MGAQCKPMEIATEKAEHFIVLIPFEKYIQILRIKWTNIPRYKHTVDTFINPLCVTEKLKICIP